MAIIEQLQDIVGEKCNFPTKDESYEFWKMEREQRKQYMISCNELIVREQYSDELLSK